MGSCGRTTRRIAGPPPPTAPAPGAPERGPEWYTHTGRLRYTLRLAARPLDLRAIARSRIKGLNCKLNGRTLYVAEDVLGEGALATMFVMFGEFQHSPEGGGLSETAAQPELEAVRNQIPPAARTPFIDAIHHGDHNE